MISVVPDLRSVTQELFKTSNKISSLRELYHVGDNTTTLADEYEITADIDAKYTNPAEVSVWAEGSYSVGDYVKHTSGSFTYTYVCIQNATTQPPTNTDYWEILWESAKGWRPIGGGAYSFNGYMYGRKADNRQYTVSNLYSRYTDFNFIGFFGASERATISDIYLKNCDMYGVSSVGSFLGIGSNSTISRCFSSGLVSGGFAGGFSNNFTNCSVSECSTSCNVTATQYGLGFVYYVTGSTINNCYADGDITGSSFFSICAGFCGVGSSSGRINKCYYNGSITSTNANTGAFTPKTTSLTVTNSFYNSTVNAFSGKGLGAGKTTAQMKDITTYTVLGGALTSAWDFQGNEGADASNLDIWTLDSIWNDGYPYLVTANDFVPVSPPTLVLLDETNVKDTSVIANGRISDFGGGTTFIAYFEYTISGDSNWEKTASVDVTDYDVNQVFSQTISSLIADTAYDVRFVVEFDSEPSYSEEGSFTTAVERVSPVASVVSATPTTWGCALEGQIESFGTYDAVTVYFKWNTSASWGTNDNTTATQVFLLDTNTPISFTETIDGLDENTEYKVATVIEYDLFDEHFDDDSSATTFSTTDIEYPQFDLQATTQIGIDYATLNGRVLTMGSFDSVSIRFAYRKGTDEYVETDSQVVTSATYFSQPISGLIENSEYDVKTILEYFYNTNINGEIQSEYDEYFTTLDAEAPTLALYEVENIDLRQATFAGEVLSFGGYYSVNVWFEYRKVGDLNWLSTEQQTITTGSGVDVTNALFIPFGRSMSLFTQESPVLVEGTNYEVRGVLEYGAESIELYSAGTKLFTTQIVESSVLVSNVRPEKITATGTITNFGEYTQATNATLHFQYTVAADTYWTGAGTTTPVSTDNAVFVEEIENLEVNTAYKIRTVLSYGDSLYSYSDTVFFNTSEIATTIHIWPYRDNTSATPYRIHEFVFVTPTYTLQPASSIGLTSATLSINISDFGSYVAPDYTTTVKFRYRKALTDTWTTTAVQSVATVGVYTQAITVEAGTNYEFKAVVNYNSEDVETSVLTFSSATPQVPVMNTLNAGVIRSSTAKLYGDIVTMGDISTVTVYFKYKKVSDASYTQTSGQEKTSAGTFVQQLTGLSPNTAYMAYSIMSYTNGYDEGDIVYFTTTSVPVQGNVNVSYGMYSAGKGLYGNSYGNYNNF